MLTLDHRLDTHSSQTLDHRPKRHQAPVQTTLLGASSNDTHGLAVRHAPGGRVDWKTSKTTPTDCRAGTGDRVRGADHSSFAVFYESGRRAARPVREASQVVCSLLIASSASAATSGQSSSSTAASLDA